VGQELAVSGKLHQQSNFEPGMGISSGSRSRSSSSWLQGGAGVGQELAVSCKVAPAQAEQVQPGMGKSSGSRRMRRS
jgi:hypothetical protein